MPFGDLDAKTSQAGSRDKHQQRELGDSIVRQIRQTLLDQVQTGYLFFARTFVGLHQAGQKVFQPLLERRRVNGGIAQQARFDLGEPSSQLP
jgi:hypothetical protein